LLLALRVEHLHARRDKAEQPLDAVERSRLPCGTEYPARDGIGGLELLQQALDLCRVLAVRVVLKHVGPKMDVPAKDFIRAFSGIDDLVASVAHRAAEKELRDTVAVAEQRLGMPDRVLEVVRDVGLPDRNGLEIRAGSRRHLAGDVAFVVGGLIERERERLDRRVGIPRGETQRGA
jgi:hypothetical protein